MRRPLGWDLACLALSGRIDGAKAVRAYGADLDEIAPWIAARRLQGVIWTTAAATRFPHRAEQAARMLAEWRAAQTMCC